MVSPMSRQEAPSFKAGRFTREVKAYLEQYEGYNIPIFLGFVEKGKIRLENLQGKKVFDELLDCIEKNNIDYEKFKLLEKADMLRESGVPLPKDLLNKIGGCDEK